MASTYDKNTWLACVHSVMPSTVNSFSLRLSLRQPAFFRTHHDTLLAQ